MPLCQKCNQFLPPGFIHNENPKTGEPLKGNLCIFCIEGKDKLPYDENKQVVKSELMKEYQIFLRRVKENNQILKDVAKGKTKEASKIIL